MNTAVCVLPLVFKEEWLHSLIIRKRKKFWISKNLASLYSSKNIISSTILLKLAILGFNVTDVVLPRQLPKLSSKGAVLFLSADKIEVYGWVYCDYERCNYSYYEAMIKGSKPSYERNWINLAFSERKRCLYFFCCLHSHVTDNCVLRSGEWSENLFFSRSISASLMINWSNNVPLYLTQLRRPTGFLEISYVHRQRNNAACPLFFIILVSRNSVKSRCEEYVLSIAISKSQTTKILVLLKEKK